ncbi:MAG: hypothetical protein IPL22_20430 [Bacteroidetes bacterium]|nr:hypothetical protein [Bacteroidota bacterium]
MGESWARNYSSTDSSGTMRTSNSVSSFSEFTFAYKSIATIPSAPFSCLDIQTQGQLQYCLLTGALLCRITTDIDLVVTGPTGSLFLPIPVNSGTVLEGYSSSASASPKWWEEDCVLSTSHTTQYNPNFLKSMFMFTLEPGAAIQNLRLRGASCNFQDYNGDQKNFVVEFLSVMIGEPSEAITNCEISCFSYAGFFKALQTSCCCIRELLCS